MWPFSQYLNFTSFWKKNLATYRNKLERNMLGNSFFTFLLFTFNFCYFYHIFNFSPTPPRPLLKNICFAIYLNILPMCNSPDWIHFLHFQLQPDFCKFVFRSQWKWKTQSLLQILQIKWGFCQLPLFTPFDYFFPYPLAQVFVTLFFQLSNLQD